MKKLQAVNANGVAGFFYTSTSTQDPWKPKISDGCLEFISICDLIKTFPSHQDVPAWKEMITMYSEQYLMLLSQKNSFGIVPFGLYSKDPGGDRKIGNYWYRYFMQPELNWWVTSRDNLREVNSALLYQ